MDAYRECTEKYINNKVNAKSKVIMLANERAIKAIRDDIEELKTNLQYQQNKLLQNVKDISVRHETIERMKSQIADQESALLKLQ